MKSLIVTILFTLYVAVSPICAKLGNTEEQVWENGEEAVTSSVEWMNTRVQIIIFKFPEGERIAGLLDGKVEIETYAFNDDLEMTPEFGRMLVEKLAEYSKEWYEMTSPVKGCRAGKSADGDYFFSIGRPELMGKRRCMTIFSKAWSDYVKSKT